MDVISGTIFFSLGLYNLFNGFSDEEPTFVARSVILLALMVSLDSLLGLSYMNVLYDLHYCLVWWV